MDSAMKFVMEFLRNPPPPSTWFHAYASLSGSITILQSTPNPIPAPIRNFLWSKIQQYFFCYHSRSISVITVEESWGAELNLLYSAAKVYLPIKISPASLARRVDDAAAMMRGCSLEGMGMLMGNAKVVLFLIIEMMVAGEWGQMAPSYRSRSVAVITVEESWGAERNLLYSAAEVYLPTRISPASSIGVKMGKIRSQKNISVALAEGEEIVDTFNNVKVTWRYVCTQQTEQTRTYIRVNSYSSGERHFELSFDSEHREEIASAYLQHVMTTAALLEQGDKELKIISCNYYDLMDGDSQSNSTSLQHPASFDTIALDPVLKQSIIDDLDRFLARRDYYKRIGKAWKRGYLLYGPPGTGKSSLVVAMAKHLKYDVYELDLGSIYGNSRLRNVFLGIPSKSIIVIEDVDCYEKAQRRSNTKDDNSLKLRFLKNKLSGLLNATDGLWSGCGQERIIIFTTNHKDKIDPALLPMKSVLEFLRNPPPPSTWFNAYASLSGSIMILQSIPNPIPPPIRVFLWSKIQKYFFSYRSRSVAVITVEESWGAERNLLYSAAEVYLPTRISPASSIGVKMGKIRSQKNISVALAEGEEIVDTFNNVKVTWRYVCTQQTEQTRTYIRVNSYSSGERHFELSFDSEHREEIASAYLQHVMTTAALLEQGDKELKIISCNYYDLMGGYSQSNSTSLQHPASFDTIALDPVLKQSIIDDLDRFLARRDYYKRIGKAWKRGYLLYGPPGTGKSSLVVAMAKHLKYDVYELDLSSIYGNSQLRNVFLRIPSKSIIVIEDVDCYEKAQRRSNTEDDNPLELFHKNKLSGLLNATDGLWSGCGQERIIIFTTNHKDKIDPALLRPGRMDMHIELSYLKPSAFPVLAYNYLGLRDGDHPLLEEIQNLLEYTEVTPASVAEALLRSEDVNVALGGVVELLKQKKTAEVNDGEDDGEDEDDGDDEDDDAAAKKRK
ncbi:hypothetical protein SLEP1_g12165 [Rubroshorea leprosula]|nr:hypothetical protein SLEP1_g12165 [Rubroshorea leprosula]